MSNQTTVDTAVFGGGCFWCTQAVFDQLRGVHRVVCGYSGGATPQPTYEQICTGHTEHAECVRIEFDPNAISYSDLLQVFFHTHDPTTPDRQGNDVGTQYRSVIFYQNERQQHAAEKAIDNLSSTGTFATPIVTQLVPAQPFFEAETYHQDYFVAHPSQPYCSAIIQPKMEKFRTQFQGLLKQ